MPEPARQDPSNIGPELSQLPAEEQAGFWQELKCAAGEDKIGLNFLQKTKSRAHAVGVVAAYGYQATLAAPIGVGAWIEGYSAGGVVGALRAGAMLGGVVGAQHVVAGQNAVEAAIAYPRSGGVIRGKFPRFSRAIATYWEANDGIISNGAAVSSVGVQSAVYNEAYTVHPDSSRKELRSFANKAILKGTVFSTGIGITIGGLGKGLQKLGDTSNNHIADVINRGFDREVIDQPVRTAGFVLALTLLKGVSTAWKRLKDERAPSEVTD